MISEARFSYVFHEPATLFDVMQVVRSVNDTLNANEAIDLPLTAVQPDQQSNGFVLTFVFANLHDALLYEDCVGVSVREIIDRDNEVFDRKNAPQQLNRK